MNIILFYEHLTREWDALLDLKQDLENNGNRVIIFSIIYERFKALTYARKYPPDVLFVPWFVDESHEKIYAPFIKLNKELIIINLHHEEIGSAASYPVYMPKTNYTKNGSFHFVWGDSFAEHLFDAGVMPDRVYITGNIRTDSVIKRADIDKKKLGELYSLDPQKKWILFAENRGYYVQRINDQLRQELIRRGMTDELINCRANYEKESLDLFVSDLGKVDPFLRTNYEFIYRPHPGTHEPEGLPDWVHVNSDRSIYDWIETCDLFLTTGSTSIFEAELYHKPCAIYDPLPIPKDIHIEALNDYPRFWSISEITEKAIKELNEFFLQNDKEIFKRYIGACDGLAKSRIIDSLYNIKNNFDLSILAQFSKDISVDSPQNYLRHYIYEIVTFLFTKTGLLYKLKFPRSAYGESKDIPYGKEADWIRVKSI